MDTISLNVLNKGPCLNADLHSLLLKFRVHRIVLTADIETAFLQITIDEKHRDYLRFLWYRNLQEESIIKYRFTRVIFGVTSSQFLLNGTVQTHANKYENIDSEFARKVKKNFYVTWTILIVVHNIQKKVLNFIKRSKVDFQEQVSISESGVLMIRNCVTESAITCSKLTVETLE